MLNPFIRFDKRFVQRFKDLKKIYLVSQSFKRGEDLFKDGEKKYLMLTHYDDLGLAKIHHNAVIEDKYAAILNLEKEEHVQKLLKMLQPDSDYIIYSSLIGDPKLVENAMNTTLREKVASYVKNQTNWRIGRDQTLVPKLELTFGELFITMRYGSQRIRVKLEEIEGY